MRTLRQILKGSICKLKESHVIDEESLNHNGFSIHFKTNCIRCHCELFITIDQLNEECLISPYEFVSLDEMRSEYHE